MLNLDQTYDFQGQAVDWGYLDGPADSAPMVLIHGFPGRRRPGAGRPASRPSTARSSSRAPNSSRRSRTATVPCPSRST